VPSPQALPKVKDLNNVNEVWAYITAGLNSSIWPNGNDDFSHGDRTEFERFTNALGMANISAQLTKSEQHLPGESEYIQSQTYQYFSYLTRVKVL
jgi:hypothetical protein